MLKVSQVGDKKTNCQLNRNFVFLRRKEALGPIKQGAGSGPVLSDTIVSNCLLLF